MKLRLTSVNQPQESLIGSHLGTPALKIEVFVKIGRFSKTQKWIRNPETIRENQAIRANLQIDAGHLRSRELSYARLVKENGA